MSTTKIKNSELDNTPDDVLVHDNGVQYRMFNVDGLDEQVKLFNSIKPKRLDGEEFVEYQIRRKFLQYEATMKNLFYSPYTNATIDIKGELKGIPYVNLNKKNKFKKKKK